MDNFDIVHFIKTQFEVRQKRDTALSIDFFDDIKPTILNLIPIVFPHMEAMDEAKLSVFYNTAKNEYISVHPVDINPSRSLVKENHRSWLTPERKIDWHYFDRYKRLLKLEGRSEKVIAEIDRTSVEILGKLGDPISSSGFWVKGLVVGNVQSGKTSNFNAVINRAIDAGYSLIIILSGIMEDLRSQTQDRIDNDVVGEGLIDKTTGRKGDKGVGLIERFGEQGKRSISPVVAITSYRSDFKKTVKESDFSLNNKNILVCKKNPGVLKNLLIWLSEYLKDNRDQHDIPLLIIDDEADNASLNNLGHKGKEFASTINGHIRALLGLFKRRSYLGYTATPFANVLQDRNETSDTKWQVAYKHNGEILTKTFDQVNNIFPDDFIQLLSPPSNYIGAKNIFETVLDDSAKKLPLLVPVIDTGWYFPTEVVDEKDGSVRPATAHDIEAGDERGAVKEDPFPDKLPPSLMEAVQCFIISIAVRLSRKPDMINSRLYNPHHTMLIHVSRFIPWQNKTKQLILAYLNNLESRILNDLPGSEHSVYRELRQIWNKYFAATMTDIRLNLAHDYQDEFLIQKSYEEIEPLLIDAVKGIEVKAVNSLTKDKLDYNVDSSRNGKKFIAVGGNRLSRGFTLEGLTINYFIRNTNYSDTLLQMGRWFGYRPGYIDCCRIFTTPDAIEKFDTTTRTIEELEAEFMKMDREGKTPADFELRVRKDPDALKITRPAILKNTTEVNWSYQDKLVQTTKFRLNAQEIERAWYDFKGFIQKYQSQFINDKERGFYVLHTSPAVLFELLNLENSFYNYSNDIIQIRKFLNKCLEQNKLMKWTIALKAQGNARNIKEIDKDFPFEVNMAQRRGPSETDPSRSDFINRRIFSVGGKSANIVSGGKDLAVLLSEQVMKDAEDTFIRERIESLMQKENINESAANAKIRANPVTYPERIYREAMSDQEGLILIYLQDLKYVFRQDGERPDDQLGQMIGSQGFNTDIPLIGFAFGFPPIYPDPGVVYAVSRYWDEEEEDAVEDIPEEFENEE
jgi:hypothetical protein